MKFADSPADVLLDVQCIPAGQEHSPVLCGQGKSKCSGVDIHVFFMIGSVTKEPQSRIAQADSLLPYPWTNAIKLTSITPNVQKVAYYCEKQFPGSYCGVLVTSPRNQ